MIEEFDWSELHLAEPFWLILLLMIPFLAWLHSKKERFANRPFNTPA